jgi:hypothetical protein
MKRIFLILLITIATFLNGCSEQKIDPRNTMDLEIQNLINSGCTEIQIDIDGNTCFLNEKKTKFNDGCTEMVTTQKLELPKCVSMDK